MSLLVSGNKTVTSGKDSATLYYTMEADVVPYRLGAAKSTCSDWSLRGVCHDELAVIGVPHPLQQLLVTRTCAVLRRWKTILHRLKNANPTILFLDK